VKMLKAWGEPTPREVAAAALSLGMHFALLIPALSTKLSASSSIPRSTRSLSSAAGNSGPCVV
jgi:hypothetical protein